MIYTLTLSPSLDYIIQSDDFSINHVNRIKTGEIFPGGKGINASFVLKRLGFVNQAISFFDSQSLNLVQHYFENEKIDLYNIVSPIQTRINVKFTAPKAKFEINGQKTELTPKMLQALEIKLLNLSSDDLLFIMGVANEEVLKAVLEIVQKSNIPFVLDIDSPKLKDYITIYQPFLIKPNQDELERLFGLSIKNQSDIISALKSIQNLGCKNVIISLDEKGAYLLTSDKKIYMAKVIKQLENVVSTVGAGDTLIAIFAAIYETTKDPIIAFRKASAAAMGTVSQNWLADKKLTEKYLDYIEVKQVI